MDPKTKEGEWSGALQRFHSHVICISTSPLLCSLNMSGMIKVRVESELRVRFRELGWIRTNVCREEMRKKKTRKPNPESGKRRSPVSTGIKSYWHDSAILRG